ncbi:MAG TPA: ABC transporter substrate-binding protein [Solirubrobacterales bacterium]|nr:ABC transporter substrate-binding protein [Solirubrobacterales bacterium]
MSFNRLFFVLCLIATLGLVAAGCGDDDDDSSDSGSEETASVSSEDCTPDQLDTVAPDTLTIATDDPAFPPYFEDNDPTNGEGFESAVAYAIAEELGFSEDQVTWVVEPFNRSYAPGPKEYDFDINQISITPKRAEAVDFSSPYYEAKQAVVALKDSPAADATTLADVADADIGVQIGTTSLDAVETVIQPTSDAQVFDTSNDVVSALKNEQVDAVVVDVPTAFFLTAVQVTDATIVGQFAGPEGDEFGALLEKDSPLTACVSAAIDSLSESGELAEIEEQWLSEATDAPILE